MAPHGTHAQELAPPASLDEPCSVSTDSRWTPQERFVWERVCVGDVANFNAAPDYGGELDPTKPAGWPQSRILRPRTGLPWIDAETQDSRPDIQQS